MTTTSSATNSGIIGGSLATSMYQELFATTTSLINTYFPRLSPDKIPNIVNYVLQNMKLESGWNMFGGAGNSRGDTIVTGKLSLTSSPLTQWPTGTYGTSFLIDYWNQPAVVNYIKVNGQTPGILDGLYPHGISQVMGAYHIPGTASYTQLFGGYYNNVARPEGLIATPIGTPVTSLYTNDAVGRRKSVLAGLIVLDSKYGKRINSIIDSTTVTYLSAIGLPGATAGSTMSPQQAILMAFGDYIGSWTTTDAVGGTALKRAVLVQQTTSQLFASQPSVAPPALPPGCTG